MIGSLGSPSLDKAYDDWKTTPPDDCDRESKLICFACGETIYPGDKVYRLEGEVFCRESAAEWLEQFAETATDEMCY